MVLLKDAWMCATPSATCFLERLPERARVAVAEAACCSFLISSAI